MTELDANSFRLTMGLMFIKPSQQGSSGQNSSAMPSVGSLKLRGT
jgi:hypothetical protein